MSEFDNAINTEYEKGNTTKSTKEISIKEIEDYYTMMIRRMNHEFGNAITLVNSSLQIIESSHPEVTGFKYWNSAMEDVQHIVRLINEISTYNNSSSISCELFDITVMIKNIVKSFSINALCSNINFSVNASDNVPLIHGDKLKLRQTFINLIKNAAESIVETDNYTVSDKPLSDSPEISISISTDRTASSVVIAITDTGCGISDEQLTKIFSPMVSFKKNGNGLGLPIIKKIVEAHNGKITVNSVLGKGSTFTVSLPVAPIQTETSDQEV